MIWLPQVVTTIVTGVVAIAAVWLTSRFAVLRAYEERVWNRKADAYSAIFEALDDLQEWYDYHVEGEFLGRDPSEEDAAERNSNYRKAKAKLNRVIASQSWLLGADLESRVQNLREKLADRHDSFFEAVDTGSFEVRQAKKDMVEIAKRELRKPQLAG